MNTTFRLLLPAILAAAFVSSSCRQADTATPEQAPIVEQPAAPAAGKKQAEPSSLPDGVAAVIGPYTLNTSQVAERFARESSYADEFDRPAPKNAEQVLMDMIAEKAMIMEGREMGLLEKEPAATIIRQFRERTLAGLLMQKQLEGKIKVSEEQIDEKVKAEPKLDRPRAKAMLERQEANSTLNGYYESIYGGYDVHRHTENFAAAADIHRRLLENPQQPSKMNFIRNNQVHEQLTDQEKNLVLATYKGGTVTIKDWFEYLCEMSPPSRPRDLNTAEGVGGFLDRILKAPILVAEARANGLENHPEYMEKTAAKEDSLLLGTARQELLKAISEPDAAGIKAFFEANRDQFTKDGKQLEYSSDLDDRIKMAIWREKSEKITGDHNKKLLDKYPYKINRRAIEDIQPPADN